jgi:hypothetical protein
MEVEVDDARECVLSLLSSNNLNSEDEYPLKDNLLESQISDDNSQE